MKFKTFIFYMGFCQLSDACRRMNVAGALVHRPCLSTETVVLDLFILIYLQQV